MNIKKTVLLFTVFFAISLLFVSCADGIKGSADAGYYAGGSSGGSSGGTSGGSTGGNSGGEDTVEDIFKGTTWVYTQTYTSTTSITYKLVFGSGSTKECKYYCASSSPFDYGYTVTKTDDGEYSANFFMATDVQKVSQGNFVVASKDASTGTYSGTGTIVYTKQ